MKIIQIKTEEFVGMLYFSGAFVKAVGGADEAKVTADSNEGI